MRLIDVFLRCLILTGGFGSNFIAMLIYAGLKTNFTPVLSGITRPHVCQHIIHSVPNVWQAVYVRNSGSDVSVFLSHDIYYITTRAIIADTTLSAASSNLQSPNLQREHLVKFLHFSAILPPQSYQSPAHRSSWNVTSYASQKIQP